MFGRIAHRYDLLNRVLSLGRDVSWRRVVAQRVAAARPNLVLDVCTGTGDLALGIGEGSVVGTDFCLPMLELAKRKIVDRGSRIPLFAADALRLPVADAAIDVVTVAFGVRNFSDLGVGLGELVRALRPGGVLLVLEFSRPKGPAAPILGWWARNVPPRIGSVLSGDSEAYSYLPASVSTFADSAEMCRQLADAGLDQICARALTGGVVTLYEGVRPQTGRSLEMVEKKLAGSRIAAEIRDEVAAEAADLERRGIVPRLDAILVGDDPASEVYVGSKAKTLAALGMLSQTHRLPEDAPQTELETLIDRLNADLEVDGILVQLPLPEAIDTAVILGRIDPAKDVDGFHPENVGLLQQGRPRMVPCTPAGIMEMLRREEIVIEGRRAVVVGRSDIVGKPMAVLLVHANATVTICHSRTRDLADVTAQAEILIAAVGVRSLIGPGHVADGAVVIDVGMHRVTDIETVNRLYPSNEKKLAAFEKRGTVLAGDVDYTRVAPKAGRITPVPGGVGPLTIAMLMANTVKAAKLRRGIR